MKRFTATEKWQDVWYRKLSPTLKCLFQYLCDNCDHAGVIDPDWEMVGNYIGAKVNPDSIRGLGSRVQVMRNGKVWICGFIRFQYGTPKRDCKQHAPVFAALEKHGISLQEVAECRLSGDSVGNYCPSNGDNSSIDGRSLLLDGAENTNKDKNKDSEGSAEGSVTKKSKARGTSAELAAYCVEIGLEESDGLALYDKWQGNGWMNNKTAIVDWRATVRSWKAQGYLPSQKVTRQGTAYGARKGPNFDDLF